MEHVNQHCKLTLAVAKNAPLPANGDYIIRDTEHKSLGLALRVYASGAKSWIVQKKLAHKPVRVVLGQFPSMNYVQAVERARQINIDFAQGRDPRAERKKRIAKTKADWQQQALTVQVAFEAYCEDKNVGASPASIDGRAAAQRKLAAGPLWTTPLAELTGETLHAEYKRLIASATSKRAKTGGKTQAAGVLRLVRAAFLHACAHRRLTLRNPFDELALINPGWYKNPARQVIVAQTDEQLKRWWTEVQALRSKTTDWRAADCETIADLLTLTLLLGTRRAEFRQLKWENVDLRDRFIHLPRDITKSGREHIIPLAHYATGIFKRRLAENQARTEPSLYVFNASRAGRDGKRTHIKELKKRIYEVADAAGIDFTLHDVRRTFATLLEELGVSALTVDKALNHAPGSVAGKHYVVQRLARMRVIYQQLEDAILTVVRTPTVVDEAADADTAPAPEQSIPHDA